MNYIPDSWGPDTRKPERAYFFGILGTLQPQYLKDAFNDANTQRCSVKSLTKFKPKKVDVTPQWAKILLANPFISGMLTITIHYIIIIKDSRTKNQSLLNAAKKSARKEVIRPKPQQFNPKPQIIDYLVWSDDDSEDAKLVNFTN